MDIEERSFGFIISTLGNHWRALSGGVTKSYFYLQDIALLFCKERTGGGKPDSKLSQWSRWEKMMT